MGRGNTANRLQLSKELSRDHNKGLWGPGAWTKSWSLQWKKLWCEEEHLWAGCYQDEGENREIVKENRKNSEIPTWVPDRCGHWRSWTESVSRYWDCHEGTGMESGGKKSWAGAPEVEELNLHLGKPPTWVPVLQRIIWRDRDKGAVGTLGLN